MQKRIGFLLGPLGFFLLLFIGPFEGLSQEGQAVLATTFWVAIWWITEAVPIAATALLPIVLFPLSGGMELSTTTAAFGHRFVFLYLGGFLIAIGIEKWNLHKRIAINIISFIGSDVRYVILGFMVATSFLSMWISNTATSVMMLPIGIAIIKELKDNPATVEDENKIFGKALMLGIAYSASIGGVATLIGTPPNLVLAGVISETYGYEITFLEWFLFGFPISITLLIFCWVYLTRVAYTFKQTEFPGGKAEITRLKKELSPISYEEKRVAIVFALAGFCWISRSYLLQGFLPALDDTTIAIAFGLLLFVLPSKNKKKALLNWKDTTQLPWGIILLFGGGMALAKAFETSGLAIWLGELMTAFGELPLFVLILLLVTAVNFLTEITSNLATTAMLLPVLAPLALEVGVHPFGLMVGAAVAASCAYMLPVATPPNAVVFGSGYLKIPDMVSRGIAMNLFSILLITLLVYFLLPVLWEIDLSAFPQGLKDQT
ncbi:MAG: SLC13 family permease [Flavobacteriaceae bacterium]|nr:SLC13 family permease [Flavobacteriaceae bacterium]